MAVTVTLSERLSAYLLAQADRVHLPVDALVEQLLTAALPLDEVNGYHAPAVDDALPALAEGVASGPFPECPVHVTPAALASRHAAERSAARR